MSFPRINTTDLPPPRSSCSRRSPRARQACTALLAALVLFDLGCGSSAKPAGTASDASGGLAGASGGTGGALPGGAGGGTAGQAAAGAGAGGGGGVSTPGGIRWIGRVDASNAAAVKFAWSGSGLVATVRGSKVSVQLQTEGATSAAFFQPVIDGTPGMRFQVASGSAQTVVLADGLAAGDHAVELYRDSEGSYGDSVFLGFVDGMVVGAPPAGRLIEIVGDSISAGYGNLGVEVHPPWDNTCTFSLDTESAYAAYGSVLARSLNAEASIIARSGWGIYQDPNGNTANVLPTVYGNTLGTQAAPEYDFPRPADAVVVNLGTNDSAPGDPGTPYEDAYVAFLHTVRSHYANAWIFLTIGPMTSDPLLSAMRVHLDNVVTKMGDAKIVDVVLDTQDATATGCDYHPNVAEDQKMATALKIALQAKLGW